MTLPIVISSIIFGRLNDSIPSIWFIVFANIISICGYTFIVVMPLALINWWLLSIGLVCIGSNVGIIYSATNYAAVKSLPLEQKGIGYGIFIANAYFFYSIGVAITGYLLSYISLQHFSKLIGPHLLTKSSQLASFVNGARPITTIKHLYPHNTHLLITYAEHSFFVGFRVVMWIFAIISVISPLACLGLVHRKKTLHNRNSHTHSC